MSKFKIVELVNGEKAQAVAIVDSNGTIIESFGDATLTSRVETLENNEIILECFETFAASTGGTITSAPTPAPRPTTGTILFDRFSDVDGDTNPEDALISEVDANDLPTWNIAKDASGNAITCSTLNSAGVFTLSALAASRYAIIFVQRVLEKNRADVKIANIIEESYLESWEKSGADIKSANAGDVIVNQNDIAGKGLMFVDSNNGLYRFANGTMIFKLGGYGSWKVSSLFIGFTSTNYPKILAEAASATNPVFTKHGDDASGLGFAADNAAS